MCMIVFIIVFMMVNDDVHDSRAHAMVVFMHQFFYCHRRWSAALLRAYNNQACSVRPPRMQHKPSPFFSPFLLRFRSPLRSPGLGPRCLFSDLGWGIPGGKAKGIRMAYVAFCLAKALQEHPLCTPPLSTQATGSWQALRPRKGPRKGF